MNLLDRLVAGFNWLLGRGVSLLGSVLQSEAQLRSHERDYSSKDDLEDYLIRKQFRGWAGKQQPPQPGKFRLLQAVVQQNEFAFKDEAETPAYKKQRSLPPSYWVGEASAEYFALTFQFIHIRVVS
jgi:hypothetical protein